MSSSLLTDPKARKVILVEHPLLPIYIKDMIARILFENLQVEAVDHSFHADVSYRFLQFHLHRATFFLSFL